MSNDDSYYVEHDGVLQETDLAVCFKIDGSDVWIPKSTIRDYDDDWVIVKAWFAKQKNLSSSY